LIKACFKRFSDVSRYKIGFNELWGWERLVEPRNGIFGLGWELKIGLGGNAYRGFYSRR
jgi:hypothetical protein